MKSFIHTFAICVMISVTVAPVYAVTHNVPTDYSTIQAGLNAATYGDTVLVQPGIYVENLIWPVLNDIKLIAAGDTSDTFIDGDQAGSVISIFSDYLINTQTLIEGFTIRNGSADSDGGGIYCSSAGPTISDCNISDNSAGGNGYGGGICCADSNPSIINCTISRNSSLFGGGIFCHEASITVIGCSISNNSAPFGGGILIDMFAGLTATNSTISDNSGAGICGYTSGSTIINCTISGNSGGGIDIDECWFTIDRCTINGNGGNGIYCMNASPTISNCAVTDHSGAGIFADWESYATITYSDFYNNSSGDYGGPYINPSLGVIVGTNANGDPCDTYFNISLDPLYVDPENDDYHLQAGSPCIDAGDPDSPLDPDDTIADIGAFYYQRPLLEILLAAEDPLIVPRGSQFEYSAIITSNLQQPEHLDIWTLALAPGGTLIGPIWRINDFLILPGVTISADEIWQEVPVDVPLGVYTYGMRIGNYPYDVTAEDSFTLEVVESVNVSASSVHWAGSGYDALVEVAESYAGYSPDQLIQDLSISAAYPNPFNSTTTIIVSIPQPAELNVSIFNINGQLVAELANGSLREGTHQFTFNAQNLPSALYFVRTTVPGQRDQVQKVMLVR